MAQAVDAVLSDDGTGLHVLAAVTFVLVVPFASFWGWCGVPEVPPPASEVGFVNGPYSRQRLLHEKRVLDLTFLIAS
jgi:hypothetical protein